MPGTLICDDRSISHSPRHYGLINHKRSSSKRLTPFLLMGILVVLGGSFTPASARDYPYQSPAIPVSPHSPSPHSPVTRQAATASMPASGQPAADSDDASSIEVVVRRGDSLGKILKAQPISDDNRQAVLAAIGDIFDPSSLQVGSHLRFTFAPTSDAQAADPRSTGQKVAAAPARSSARLIQTVELIADGGTTFTIHVDAETPLPAQAAALPAKPGTSAASSSSAPSTTSNASIWTAANGQQQTDDADQFVVRRAAGIVGPNFRKTLQAVHLPAPLINEILIGFKAAPGQHPAPRDVIPQNAAFEVIYEGVQNGSKFDTPQLRYAMINDGRKTRRIYRYQTDDATTALMQADGHGVALIDLGRPLQINARITSPFGWRIHPVFGDRRFHEGVDFGAPTGTPVIATSDGVIEDIGWRGNYGDYIRLRHDGHLATAYAHLSAFARGLKRGSTVKRGDVIAYVGRTGVATGPHLYYEVLVDGKQIDPMKTPPAVPVSLQGAQLAEFEKYVETATAPEE